ncbi:class I SAM-dependent methyltransferase [Thermoleptolyngbya sichuanensis XZ-Cy5]|uniref:class I SAM-dependent methyltransferase n=1 Tax=Thermoleptolyngbya sichuanensis TaxID=2885951 RepID=UPI00240DDD3D|nr:class I SAM-dependent methyltransferase [Thermoleptolyngbya sichuanensis]MDG2615697.1 class I SAM-dependent methyltransferase [Thermoleptolyngbya sichuanensis XZ-Cy5]
MTAALPSQSAPLPLTLRLVNVILSIKPLALLAKHNARNMMIKRAEAIGVYWRQEVQALRARGEGTTFSPAWEEDLAAVQNPDLVYPDYYCCSFHAYEEGNLGWEPAMEVEVAAHAVHARIWPDGGAEGDTRLRQSFLDILKEQGPEDPQAILDLGCSVGMSTFALQSLYPQAALTGVDLSPYFLAIARHRARTGRQPNSLHTLQVMGPKPDAPAPRWLHAAAEETGLPDASFDLVSAFLIFHELPQSAAVQILQEARRVLRPGGTFALMDMNPRSEIYAKMPPYILTLLKSTEPYLDQYFSLDLEQALVEAGFEPPTITCNTPRHRTVIARAR